MTERIRLVVAYDGTDFRGWAANPGQRTVQGTLKDAVSRTLGEETEVVGASRTDAGAHARGQVCHFDARAGIPAERWTGVLNRILPPDVRVLDSRAVPEAFHSRFCARWRLYRYRILVGAPDPFRERYAFRHGRGLDLGAMREAADRLIGEHDFRAFSEELKGQGNTVRALLRVDVAAVRDEVRIDVAGTAFVKGMMRRIAGFLLEVGKGQRPADDAEGLLGERRGELQWPVVLPAKGLTLLRVAYGRTLRDVRLLAESERHSIERDRTEPIRPAGRSREQR
ncbi:MAG: tRNA pseudouridine(38-40) synthase TruA [Fimbriimonadales bacterium]|nr:tRNA pseudouridine(38-40) synthase TruA [Fimbriimonadales bacterium]